MVNELTSLEVNQNPGNGVISNRMILGDLNAGCAYFPKKSTNKVFQAGWNWYIDRKEKTNTAAKSHCGYDRIILSDSLNQYYKGHGIYTPGIAQKVNNVWTADELNGVQVSDHFLVWVELGSSKQKKKIMITAASKPVLPTKKLKVFKQGNAQHVYINGANLQPVSTTVNVFIVPYSQTFNYKGGQTHALKDVRGQPTAVAISADGTLASDVEWSNPVKTNADAGLFNIVVDVNRDNQYNVADGDFSNHENQIDFIVVDGTEGHNQLVTLGDNGQVRELYNSGLAKNIYGLAKDLPASAEVDYYTVSKKLLPAGITTWEQAKALGTIELEKIAIPVNKLNGWILAPELTLQDKVNTTTIAPDGSFFESVWPNPYILLNMMAVDVEPPDPDYKESYVDPITDDSEPDVCAAAIDSMDLNFQAVCNFGNRFTDYYGTAFNLIIDVNRDGEFNQGDIIDTLDTGDMGEFFDNPSNITLGPANNGNAAVGEYKEFLNAKLSLNQPLAANDTYDAATQAASNEYLCSPTVPTQRFSAILSGSQIGYQVLNANDYEEARSITSGVYSYVNTDMTNLDVADNADVCITAENTITLKDLSTGKDARLLVKAPVIAVEGTHESLQHRNLCLMAESNLILAAGTAAAAPATGGLSVFLAGPLAAVGLAEGLGCLLTH